jgi:hypothetical protein
MQTYFYGCEENIKSQLSKEFERLANLKPYGNIYLIIYNK